MPGPRALVVDDSPEVRILVRSVLEKEGFVVTCVPTGSAGIEAARDESPDLIVLDLSLPDVDGVEVCRQIRAFSDAYLVMVTARDDEIDKIVGLTVGADDYITKPFSPREFVARVRVLSRRPRSVPQEAAAGIVFGGLSIDLAAREMLMDGAVVELTRIEFELLKALVSAPRRTFTRRQLIEKVWGEWYGDDHVLDVHMGNLRRKMGESSAHPRFIRTVRGVGYRFVGQDVGDCAP